MSNASKKPASKKPASQPVKTPKKSKKPAAGTVAALLASPKTVEQFSLVHEHDGYGKAGETIGNVIARRHVIADKLNGIGIGGSIKLTELYSHCLATGGLSQNDVDVWLHEQSAIKKIPKYRLTNGVCNVLKLHVSRATGRTTGTMKIVAKKK